MSNEPSASAAAAAAAARNLERVRDNQRRSRARRREHLSDLEARVRDYELQGVNMSAEVQKQARKVAEENRKLHALLLDTGVDRDSIAAALAIPISDSISPPSKSEAVRQLYAAMEPRGRVTPPQEPRPMSYTAPFNAYLTQPPATHHDTHYQAQLPAPSQLPTLSELPGPSQLPGPSHGYQQPPYAMPTITDPHWTPAEHNPGFQFDRYRNYQQQDLILPPPVPSFHQQQHQHQHQHQYPRLDQQQHHQPYEQYPQYQEHHQQYQPQEQYHQHQYHPHPSPQLLNHSPQQLLHPQPS